MSFIQDLLTIEGVAPALTHLAASNECINIIKSHLREPNNVLTEHEDAVLKSTIIRLEGAGVPEVNGDYKFNSLVQVRLISDSVSNATSPII